MKKYNEKADKDLIEGFDPRLLDKQYRDHDQKLYNQQKSTMPKQVDFTFDIKHSGIEMTEQVIEMVRDSFEKF